MSSQRMGLYFFSFIILLSNCNVGSKNITHATDSTGNHHGNIGIIKPNLYLENRVSNCDSAYVFMQHSIKPGYMKKIPTTEDIDPGIVFNVSVPGESPAFLQKDVIIGRNISNPNQRFYISLDCFIGRDFQYFLDVFVEPKYHEKIWHHIIKQERNRNYFYLDVLGSIRFGIVVVNRKVAKAIFPIGIAIE